MLCSGEHTFRSASDEMWGALSIDLPTAMNALAANLTVDPGFRGFRAFCQRNLIHFNVVSAGLEPVLRGVLDRFVGADASATIGIVANGAEIPQTAGKGVWRVRWRHGDSPLGHDKARSIVELRAAFAAAMGKPPIVVFVGDGVSDLPAAREADVLFARRGLRLEEYCVENDIRCIPYNSFVDVQRELAALVKLYPLTKPLSYSSGPRYRRSSNLDAGLEGTISTAPAA